MIVVGIDVAKDKHDCFIMNSEGEVLFGSFVIQNNREGFDSLYEKICSVVDDFTKVKVGLEATGHTATIFWAISLIRVCRPTLSIRYIPIFTEKV